MKTSELKKIVEDNKCIFKKDITLNGIWIFNKNNLSVAYISNNISNNFNLGRDCPKVIAQAILDYAYTPLEKREECEEQKKYWVVLPKRNLQKNALSNSQQVSILSHKEFKYEYTLKELRELDFLKEIDGKWYMKLELEELKHD